jgi:hypothetical protein
MAEPICFQCKHFRQYQPLTFLYPGECGWQPAEAVPAWLEPYMVGTDYYGPKREIRNRSHVIEECLAFEATRKD